MNNFLEEFKIDTTKLLERLRGSVQYSDVLEYLIYMFFAKRISSQIERDIDKYAKELKVLGLCDSEIKEKIKLNEPR